MKKTVLMILLFALVLSMGGCAGTQVPAVPQQNAAEQTAENNVRADEEIPDEEAESEEEQMSELGFSSHGFISAGNSISVAVTEDGHVLYAGNKDAQVTGAGACAYWSDIVSVAAGQLFVVGLRTDGSTCVTPYIPVDTKYFPAGYEAWDGAELEEVNSWTDVVELDSGPNHVLGLKKDGTVVAAGMNTNGQCDVLDWTQIVAVAAGTAHSVGLRSDGTVVAAGKNKDGECNVSGWQNVVAVSAGNEYTVGLTADGKVLYTGPVWETGPLEPQLESWTDIVKISAGDVHVVGLKSDGTVISTSPLPAPFMDKGQNRVEKWCDIVDVSAGTDHTLGLKSDGTVVTVGNNGSGACDVSSWKNIKLP